MNSPFPDWRDDAAYPSSFDAWDVYQWAWEFLRRNKEYQADFAHYAALPEWTDEYGKTGKLSGESFCPWEPMEYRYCDPPALPGETGEEYEARMDAAGLEYEHPPLESHLMDKWGIYHILDPAAAPDEVILFFQPMDDLSYLPPWGVSIPSDAERLSLGKHCSYPTPDQIGQITLRFDVRFPIDRQIEETKATLLWLQSTVTIEKNELVRKSLPRQDKIPEFLRIFDAKEAGATTREIAAVLYPKLDNKLPRDPGITRVEYAAKQANKLVLKEYRDLLRWL